MTNEAILTKAIERAVAGGWKPFPFTQTFQRVLIHESKYITEITLQFEHEPDELAQDWRQSLETTIFNHDFAKALWPGEPDREPGMGRSFIPVPYWQMHLQHMVIADNPIAYLGEHL